MEGLKEMITGQISLIQGRGQCGGANRLQIFDPQNIFLDPKILSFCDSCRQIKRNSIDFNLYVQLRAMYLPLRAIKGDIFNSER